MDIFNLLQEKIFAKISDSNNIIEFNNTHALLGNKLSISFNIYINDLESHYNILTLDNLIIKVQDNSVKLIKGNTTVRTLNVNKTITNCKKCPRLVKFVEKFLLRKENKILMIYIGVNL